MKWLWAAAAIAIAFVVGTMLSKLAKGSLERRGPRTAELGSAVASMVFSLVLVVGLLIALGIVRAESLEELRDDAIKYLPRALSAMIVVILGGVVGTLASTAAQQSIGLSLGRAGEQIPALVKAVVMAFAVILAASQLGIDTTVINIVVAAIVFGISLAFALVVGMGSRPVATEIASGRALRRLVGPGDTVESNGVSGRIVALHATAVEVESADAIRLIPNTLLLDEDFSVVRLATSES